MNFCLYGLQMNCKIVDNVLPKPLFVLYLPLTFETSTGTVPFFKIGLKTCGKKLVNPAIGVAGFFLCKKIRLGISKDNVNWPTVSGNC